MRAIVLGKNQDGLQHFPVLVPCRWFSCVSGKSKRSLLGEVPHSRPELLDRPDFHCHAALWEWVLPRRWVCFHQCRAGGLGWSRGMRLFVPLVALRWTDYCHPRYLEPLPERYLASSSSHWSRCLSTVSLDPSGMVLLFLLMQRSMLPLPCLCRGWCSIPPIRRGQPYAHFTGSDTKC